MKTVTPGLHFLQLQTLGVHVLEFIVRSGAFSGSDQTQHSFGHKKLNKTHVRTNPSSNMKVMPAFTSWDCRDDWMLSYS